MNRRLALVALLAALGAPRAVYGRPERVPKIGYLTLPPVGDTPSAERLAFLRGLEELGYVDGKTAHIEYASGEMDLEILDFAAQALVDAEVDVIAAAGTVAALAAKKASSTIPVVMVFSSEPVVSELVADLARPGGNVTGIATMQTELDPKRLAMLKEFAPEITRVAVLWTRIHPSHKAELRAIERAGVRLGLAIETFDVTDDLTGVLQHMGEHPPDAVLVMWDYRTLAYRRYIADFALAHRLPTSMPLELFVTAGGLMSYGPNVETIFRRSAFFVDRILRGARPENMPVERPAKFDLVVNAGTARRLGLALPPTLLLLADRIVD